MKQTKMSASAIALAFLVAGVSAFAVPPETFTGYFSGYYAPANWTSARYNHAPFDSTAFVYTGNAPASLEIDGAVDAQQQVSAPQPPVSIIDYFIVLDGTGLQPVAFNYSFTGAADGFDAAALIYDNGSGFQVVTSLSTLLNGTQQSYLNNTSFQGGQRFGFRVYSNNDNLADALVISAVPEPSTLTFLSLGVGALLWNVRRRQS